MSRSSLCVSCSMQFTLFKKKNRCPACKSLYCSPCFKKGETLPRRNVRQCFRCHALSSQPFQRSELMLLSVKDLKGFLEQKNVSSTGCTEKRDLVDVIINHQARPPVETSHVNEARTNQPPTSGPYYNAQTSATGSSSQQQPQSQPRSRVASEGMNDFFGGLNISPEIDHFVQSLFGVGEGDIRGSRTSGQANSNNRQNESSGQMSFRMPGYRDDFTPSCVHPTQVKAQSKISLGSIKDESDIRKLSAKELKVLLDDNFVDYKGCVEKEELVQRVVMLWESKKVGQNAATSTNETPEPGGENEICKVCMDRVIDCVFLECGHLVTCVDCGRQLRECPMCRQNIVRIVRVFKT